MNDEPQPLPPASDHKPSHEHAAAITLTSITMLGTIFAAVQLRRHHHKKQDSGDPLTPDNNL